MKLLNNSNWTLPGSPCFSNLESMQKLLEAIRLHVESGEVLVLNFVFQNLILRGVLQDAQTFDPEQGLEEHRKRELSSQKVNLIRRPCYCWEIQGTPIIVEFQKIWKKC
jgi:hypothetical protein